jgi:hypothetical protein
MITELLDHLVKLKDFWESLGRYEEKWFGFKLWISQDVKILREADSTKSASPPQYFGRRNS